MQLNGILEEGIDQQSDVLVGMFHLFSRSNKYYMSNKNIASGDNVPYIYNGRKQMEKNTIISHLNNQKHARILVFQR